MDLPVTYLGLKNFVTDCRIESLTDLLQKLPEAFRANYVLGYHSLSLQRQSVDYDHPRVIAYDPAGDLTLAYVGNPSHPQYHHLEILELVPDTGKFETHEIRFPGAREGSARLKQFIDRPRSCIQCHGETTLPIWRSYNRWPGFYGSSDDVLNKQNIYEHEGDELGAFQHFLAANTNHERYSLLTRSSGREMSPYNDKMGDSRPNSEEFRPNLRFTRFILNLQAKSVVSTLKAHPGLYSDLGSLFLYPLLSCERDEGVRAQVRDEIDRSIRAHPELRTTLQMIRAHVSSYTPEMGTQREGDLLAKIVRPNEHNIYYGELLGIFGIKNDSLQLPFYGPLIDGAFNLGRRVLFDVMTDISASDSEFSMGFSTSISQVRSPVFTRGSLNHLEQDAKNHCNLIVSRVIKSVRTLQSIRERFALTPMPQAYKTTPGALVRQCAGCHSLESDLTQPTVPRVPFAEPDRIRGSTLLQSGALLKSGAMPPGGGLGDGDRSDALEALDGWVSK